RPKSGDRHCLERAFSLRLCDYVVTSSIRKTNVAQDHVEFVRLHDFQRGSRIIRNCNLVTKMSEQARQSMSRVSVVFHEQDAQGFCGFLRSLRIHAALFHALSGRVKGHFEGAAKTSAAALHFDRPAVEIDKMLRNGEAQAKPPELTPDRWISLLEWLEEAGPPVGLDFDPHFGELCTQ